MAQKNTAKNTEEQTKTENTGGQRGQKVMVKDPERGEMARVDLIRDLYYKEGWSRGDIRKHLAEKCEHDVRYQIVFAATKQGEQGKPDTDPRNQPKESKESKAEENTQQDAAE